MRSLHIQCVVDGTKIASIPPRCSIPRAYSFSLFEAISRHNPCFLVISVSFFWLVYCLLVQSVLVCDSTYLIVMAVDCIEPCLGSRLECTLSHTVVRDGSTGGDIGAGYNFTCGIYRYLYYNGASTWVVKAGRGSPPLPMDRPDRLYDPHPPTPVFTPPLWTRCRR